MRELCWSRWIDLFKQMATAVNVGVSNFLECMDGISDLMLLFVFICCFVQNK